MVASRPMTRTRALVLWSVVCSVVVGAGSCAPQSTRRDGAPNPSESTPQAPAAPIGKQTMNFDTPEWKAIDKLIDEQKLEAARTEIGKVRAAAEKSGNASDWTRALIRDVQLGTALGGVETAVRTLREAKWPDDGFSQLVLELYYATTLVNYVDHYAYEIAQRERVESKGPVDLKAWTRDQIVKEALTSLQRVWSRRDALAGSATIFGPYVALNNYPAGVRDTLRDVLSYYLVELLANTSYWRPAEQNDLFRLDHAALLAGQAKDATGKEVKSLDDGGVHPLVRAIAVLSDLTAWHKGAGHKEAAFEAELERLRRVHNAFSHTAERKAQTAALIALLQQNRSLAWWSMGQYWLAQWTRDEGELVKARELALEGDKAYPGTPGAVECHRLVAEIESPDYNLSGNLIDGAQKRSIALQHKNVKELYFRAYQTDLIQRVESARDYNLLPSGAELQKILQGKPVAEWTSKLPDLGDYQMHQTFVTPPMTSKGFYTVYASPRADFSPTNNRITAVHLFISQLVIRYRTEPDGAIEFTVYEGDSGKPAANVELLLYEYNYQSGHKRVDTKKTDKDGMAKVGPGFSIFGSGGKSLFVIARSKDDVAASIGSMWVGKPGTPSEISSTFVFTDRSIYRPTQKVEWKVLAYQGKETSWRSNTNTKLAVSLYDGNGQEVKKVSVKTNDYGTASGSFDIPTGRLLGQWSIRSSIGGAASIRVEEYKRPTFEVALLPNKEAARLNHPVTLRGEGKYYFGLPVQSGQLKWKVERQAQVPWWSMWSWWAPPQAAPQVIASGAGAVDEKGKFEIKFTAEADPQARKGTQFSYRVSVDLTDEGGETRSTSRSFVLGQVAIDARLELPFGFFVADTAGEIALRRTNLDGDPRPGKGRYRVFLLQQPKDAVLPADMPVRRDPDDKKPHTPGDDLQRRDQAQYNPDRVIASWADGKEVAAAEIATAEDGTAKLKLPKLAGGAYRVRYESIDDFGEKLEVFREFLVADGKTHLALPSILKVEQASVESGGVARVLATTGLRDQPMWLEIYQAQKLLERRALAPGAPALHEIKLGADRRGGIAVMLVGLRDYQQLQQSASVFVPWDDRALQLEFSTFRDLLRPGAKETFRVTVRGGKDRAAVAAAELLGYMYDRSLDVFAPHSPPSPLNLYPNRAYTGQSVWALNTSHTLWVHYNDWYQLPSGASLHGDSLQFPDAHAYGGLGMRGYGYGGGGRMRGEEGAMGGNMPARFAAAPGGAPPPPPAPMQQAKPAELKVEGRVSVTADALVIGNHDGVLATTPAAPTPAVEVRSNFSETAFFLPTLLTDKDGSAALEFTVPDSVTSWNVWVHAVTKDLRSGSVNKTTRSVKDLIVRPYLPRFLREVDDVALKVVVQNASKQALTGNLTFEIFDPATQKSVADEFSVKQTTLPFSVGAEGSTNLTIPMKAPRRVGEVAIRVVGKAGALSDGELRPLPLLPSRLHLVQSKFATLRGDGSARTLQLADLVKNDDPTRQSEQLVVTVDAQLFMTVLKALPFLVDYPYECSEQTLNRFLSAGIVASVFNKYPSVKKMAEDLVKQRTTILDKFDAPDPNRTTLLEESPWLVQSKGGPELDERLIKVLDPEVAKRERDRALSRLTKMQTSIGGFPWFPGGPPSPYMTLYLMIGFARASEFQIDVPKDMIQKAWQYLAQHYRSEIVQHLKKGDASAEFIVLLHFATTSFPDISWLGGAFTDAERNEMLAYSFERWKKLQPLIKTVLTLSLLREKRKADAKLVFDSVMDSAKSTEDEGTFWKAEDRAWLWYNDRIETHAFALRTLLEINEQDPKLEGLVVWLLLNKKLNQWKSTRATAEVIYSLVKYLDKKAALGNRETVAVTVGGMQKQELVFEPDQYKGKQQIRIDGKDVKPEMGKIDVKKTGKGVAFASATWHYATDKLPDEGRGDLFSVKRTYFRREAMGGEKKLVPLAENAKLQPGDEIEVQLEIKSRAQAEYIHLRDPRPAGLEPPITVSKYHYDLGLVYYEEVRDTANNFFIEWLPAGEYTLKYRLRANLAGHFRVGPATLQSMYAPEFAAFSAGHNIHIEAAK